MFRGSKSYFSSSKKGGKLTVTRQVKKIYLRTDIACGSEACAVCGALLKEMTGVATLDANAKVLLIPDTNVFLHNIDAMESPAIADVVVLDTVLAEVKNLNKSVYERLARVVRDPEKKKRFYVFSNENHRDTAAEQEPGESANDHNDKLIRNAAKWYQLHLSQVENGPEVVLLTHDIGNKEKAVKAGIRALSVAEYVTEYKREDASLLEMVVTATGATVERRGAGSNIYEPHLSAAEADAAVRTGAVLKGPLRAGNVHEGTVRVASEKVDDETGKTTKVFAEYLIASKKDMNRAIDGDAVGVVPYPVRQWTKPSRFLRKGEKDTGDGSRITANTDDADEARLGGFIPTARVVALIENNRRPVCGSIMWNEDQSSSTATERVLFRPIKSNFPHVSLQTRQAAQWAGKRLQVVIDDWNINMNYPDGHCVKVLGDIGDKDVEAEVILLENDVPHYEFSNKVIACLPTGKWQVEPDQLKVRRDFRDRTVVSVDPPGCKDIDDALHCHRLPNGNLEVGVHIADVTHFVKEASPLDDEASKRSTSVYLVDRRIDMLPKLLTENLCSLVGGEDRYTFSVVWEVTPDCEVVNTTYTKGIIKSKWAMSYYTAQGIVDDPNDHSTVATGLKDLLRLSKILKARRVEAGALTLASQEMKFTIDMEGDNSPTDVQEYVHIPTMSMIEEFMLFANVAVAEKIEREFPKWACLRRHPPPPDGAFEALNEALESQAMPLLKAGTSRELADSLDACNDAKDPYFNRLVRVLTTRCMNQAKYFSSGEMDKQQYWHYGLAMPIYTHFTSPIRRYADVIVHRQLAAAIGIAKRSTKHMDAELMLELTGNMNTRHTAAQHAGRDSRNLYIGFVFDNYKNGREEQIPEEDGYIVRRLENGVVVMVPRYGTEGTCYFEDCTELGEKIKALRQFDKVRVKIILRPGSYDDVARNKLLYKIVQHVHVQRVACAIPPTANVGVSEEPKDKAQPPSMPFDPTVQKKADKPDAAPKAKQPPAVAKRPASGGGGDPKKRRKVVKKVVKKAAAPQAQQAAAGDDGASDGEDI